MDETNTELAARGPHATSTPAQFLETKILGIAGMTSDPSIRKIERAFQCQPGVVEITIDRENALATITYDARQTNMAELHELLLRSGYKSPVAVTMEN